MTGFQSNFSTQRTYCLVLEKCWMFSNKEWHLLVHFSASCTPVKMTLRSCTGQRALFSKLVSTLITMFFLMWCLRFLYITCKFYYPDTKLTCTYAYVQCAQWYMFTMLEVPIGFHHLCNIEHLFDLISKPLWLNRSKWVKGWWQSSRAILIYNVLH